MRGVKEGFHSSLSNSLALSGGTCFCSDPLPALGAMISLSTPSAPGGNETQNGFLLASCHSSHWHST